MCGVQSWSSIVPPPPCRCWKPKPPTSIFTLPKVEPRCVGRHCAHDDACRGYATTRDFLNQSFNT